MECEVWKDVKGYEGLYKVSNTGKVKSFQRNREKLLSDKYYENGYLRASLSKNNEKKKVLIHRLVAETFIPNPENKPEVNHIDGNKKNNNASNLEWCTRCENVKHAWKTGLNEEHREKLSKTAYKTVNKLWEKNKKPVIQMDLDGNFIREFDSAKEAFEYYGIKRLQTSISACCTGRRKTAHGYKWKFKE